MSSYYPALGDLNHLADRVLVFAPHADDEVFGCGGTLAFHTERGDPVRVVILTDGAGGDPAGLEADIVARNAAADDYDKAHLDPFKDDDAPESGSHLDAFREDEEEPKSDRVPAKPPRAYVPPPPVLAKDEAVTERFRQMQGA